MAEPFAQPLTKLGDSGIGVAAAPSGGMGVALTADGKIPGGVLFLGSTARRIAAGSAVFNWSATQAGSDALTIPHGLGLVPVTYQVIVEGLGNPLFAYATTAVDATNLYLQAWDPAGNVGAGASRTAYWWAAG